MVTTIGLFLAGLVLLYFGAEWLVTGASRGALRFGIAPLIVGLTVVSFGTSAPELLVSLLALIEGKDSVSIGNILGSNIANIALILGCSALVRPVQVSKEVLSRDYPIMVLATLLMVLLAYDGEVSRLDGAVMVGGMLTYMGYSIKRGLNRPKDETDLGEQLIPEEVIEAEPEATPAWKDIGQIVLGIAALAGGAYFLVEGAIEIAQVFGIPDLVVGITVVAVGTSLPELATSLVAAYRGQSDISVGNVVGSNIFNVLLVLGVVAVILPMQLEASRELWIDLGVMVGVSLVLWPVMRVGYVIRRPEGAALVIGYIAYTIYLFMRTGAAV